MLDLEVSRLRENIQWSITYFAPSVFILDTFQAVQIFKTTKPSALQPEVKPLFPSLNFASDLLFWRRCHMTNVLTVAVKIQLNWTKTSPLSYFCFHARVEKHRWTLYFEYRIVWTMNSSFGETTCCCINSLWVHESVQFLWGYRFPQVLNLLRRLLVPSAFVMWSPFMHSSSFASTETH